METSEDRISHLPDSLIHHILSFLDMVFVFETSTLSTRWRYLWTSLPVLNFDSDVFYKWRFLKYYRMDRTGFSKFVYHILLRHENSDVQRCSLTYSEGGEQVQPQCFVSWIDGLVRKKIKEFHLHVETPQYHFKIPDCLFTCESLIELKMCIFDFKPEPVLLPESITLAGPRAIHLEGIYFRVYTLTSSLHLTCPVLESLTMDTFELDSLEELTIDAPKLQHLSIVDENVLFSLGYYYEYDGNAIREGGIKIKINAPNLKSFECHEPIHRQYNLCGCSSLEKAYVCFETEYLDHDPQKDAEEKAEIRKAYGQQLNQFFKGISMVKYLTVASLLLEFVSKPPAMLESLPIQFANLRYLELGEFISRDCINGMMYLLRISPNLETLILEKYCCCSQHGLDPHFEEEYSDIGDVSESWEVLLSSQCMLHHLKHVEMQNVHGCATELELLKILLESSLILEKLNLLCSTSDDPDAMRRLIEFKDQLLTLTIASPSLIILIS